MKHYEIVDFIHSHHFNIIQIKCFSFFIRLRLLCSFSFCQSIESRFKNQIELKRTEPNEAAISLLSFLTFSLKLFKQQFEMMMIHSIIPIDLQSN